MAAQRTDRCEHSCTHHSQTTSHSHLLSPAASTTPTPKLGRSSGQLCSAGSTWLPAEVDALGGYSIFDGESCEYLVIRHDGVFVDPSGSVVYQDATAAIEARRAVPTVDTPHSPHPASLAHMANHSGSGEEINAVAWPWGVLLPEVDEDEDVDTAVEFFAKLHREDEEITARWPN